MTENNEINGIRKILRNEISWLVMFGGFIFAIFQWVILPINALQISVEQVKQQIADEISQGKQNSDNISALQQDQAKQNAELDQLLRVK